MILKNSENTEKGNVNSLLTDVCYSGVFQIPDFAPIWLMELRNLVANFNVFFLAMAVAVAMAKDSIDSFTYCMNFNSPLFFTLSGNIKTRLGGEDFASIQEEYSTHRTCLLEIALMQDDVSENFLSMPK